MDTRGLAFEIQPCPQSTFCTQVECVYDGVSQTASCPITDVSDQVCPDNMFCADVTCDDDVDQCVTTDVSAQQCPSDFCFDATCDEVGDACVLNDVSDEVCADTQCTVRTCNAATSTCDEVILPDGQPCDDGLFCNGADSCMAGVCTSHAGNPCSGPDGDTDCAESCDETSDTCTALDPAGTECRPVAGPCDVAESCTGADAACPADAIAPADTQCGPDLGICDPPDVCDGVSKTGCELRIAQDGTVCGFPNAGACDETDECFAGQCLILTKPAGTVCRAGSGDQCDPAETCDGSAVTCPADVVTPVGTECRPAADVCDVAETCSGTPGAACPADGFEPAGTECQAAADECDAPETCTGSAATCPTEDVKAPDGTACAEGNECMVGDGPMCLMGTCQPGSGCPIVRIADVDDPPVGPTDTLDVTIDIPPDTPGVGNVVVRVDGKIAEPSTEGAGDGVSAAVRSGNRCGPGKRVLRRKVRLLEGQLTPASVARVAARLNKRGKRCLRSGDLDVDATIDVMRRPARRKRPTLLDRFRRSAGWKRG